ncbi:hypothetical protein Tco_1266706 [Tanacetum coccineum]
MFVGTASEIWQKLEKRFFLSDGSRKYKLNKDTYEITQSGSSVVFLAALNKQKEEQRLFQLPSATYGKPNQTTRFSSHATQQPNQQSESLEPKP